MEKYSDELEMKTNPSQWINFLWFVFGIGLITLIVPALLAIYKFFDVYLWTYQFRERTIIEQRGVFSVSRTEVHYYRIKSIKIDEPFLMRLFSLGNITIVSSDPLQRELRLIAVHKPVVLKEAIRERVHYMRKKENVREFDKYDLLN